MAQIDYDRYSLLKLSDGTLEPQPFVSISESPSDKYEDWREGFSRMDKLANKYYNNPFYDFLILLANPEFLNEFEIPDGTTIRIPFPLARVKSEYEAKIEFFMRD
jgi:hypothetical protein